MAKIVHRYALHPIDSTAAERIVLQVGGEMDGIKELALQVHKVAKIHPFALLRSGGLQGDEVADDIAFRQYQIRI